MNHSLRISGKWSEGHVTATHFFFKVWHWTPYNIISGTSMKVKVAFVSNDLNSCLGSDDRSKRMNVSKISELRRSSEKQGSYLSFQTPVLTVDFCAST